MSEVCQFEQLVNLIPDKQHGDNKTQLKEL